MARVFPKFWSRQLVHIALFQAAGASFMSDNAALVGDRRTYSM
ncbi:hypothetical protein [Novosphingobium sp. Rr 2-17]|nr:hypothetical protein [Novosphingobium sp. Rr 2-17]